LMCDDTFPPFDRVSHIVRYSPECVERLYEKWFSEGISLL
jgi:hypothetical protein